MRNEKEETRNQKCQIRVNNLKKIIIKEEPKETKIPNWIDKNKIEKI